MLIIIHEVLFWCCSNEKMQCALSYRVFFNDSHGLSSWIIKWRFYVCDRSIIASLLDLWPSENDRKRCGRRLPEILSEFLCFLNLFWSYRSARKLPNSLFWPIKMMSFNEIPEFYIYWISIKRYHNSSLS